MNWTRRRSGTDENWTISVDGEVVGTVYYAVHLPTEREDRWYWATSTVPGGSGYLWTLQQGLEAVRRTVLRDGLDKLPPPYREPRRLIDECAPEDQVEF